MSEKDPRVLRALVLEASAEVARLQREVDRLQAADAGMRQSAFNLDERMKLLQREFFGRSREERPEASDRPRDKSQEEALLFSQAAFPAPVTRGPKNKMKGDGLEDVIIVREISGEVLREESVLRGLENPSADQWLATGLFDQSMKIQIIERRYVRELHRRMKYKLDPKHLPPDCEKEIIITAPAGPALLPGMNYTTEFVASVVADKFISHVPLERQTREMESLGLGGIKTSTLSRLCGLAACGLEPLAEEIRHELIGTDLALHIDETPWKIQNKDEKDGFMWVMSNRYGSYYFFKPTRSGQVLKEKLAGYSGPALTDGFAGYNVLGEIGIKHGLCWSHYLESDIIRRTFQKSA